MGIASFQAGVLKPSGRRYTRLILVRTVVPGQDRESIYKNLLKELYLIADSHSGQVRDAHLYRNYRLPGKPCVNVSFSREGMKLLFGEAVAAGIWGEHKESKIFKLLGYQERKRPPVFKGGIDLMITVGHNNFEELHAFSEIIEDRLRMAFSQKKDEDQQQLHIGFLDGQRDTQSFRALQGRSLPVGPLGFAEGIFQEQDINKLFARIGVPELIASTVVGHGTFVKFARFIVDRPSFDASIKRLLERIKPKGDKMQSLFSEEDYAYAKALLVGRYPDGRSLAAVDIRGDVSPDYNDSIDLSFVGDTEGKKCPFAAHVRVIHKGEGQPFILRRGVPFRKWSDGVEETGLLFISYQRSITDDFLKILRQMVRQKDLLVYNETDKTPEEGNKYDRVYLDREKDDFILRQELELRHTSIDVEAELYLPSLEFLRRFVEGETTLADDLA